MQFLHCNVFENVFYRILKTQSLCIIMTMCTIVNIMNLSSRLHAWINLILERYPVKVSNQLLTMLIKEQKSNMRKLLEYWPILSSVSSFQKLYVYASFNPRDRKSVTFLPFCTNSKHWNPKIWNQNHENESYSQGKSIEDVNWYQISL